MLSSKQEQREVFEELGLSRKTIKKAEGIGTPPTAEVSVPGEIPDENVISIIEMLQPSVKQLRRVKSMQCQEDETRQGLNERKTKEITVDRSKKMTNFTKDHKKLELREESKEVCLSREMTNSNLHKDEDPPENTVSEGLPPGELPDEAVSSIIEMLRPRIRQSQPNKNGIVKERENKEENPKCIESERRARKNDSMRKPSGILAGQPLQISSISTLEPPLTLQSKPSRGSGDEIKTAHSTQIQLNETGKNDISTITEKELATMASNTETFKRRRSRRRSKKKKPKQFTDISTATTGFPCPIHCEQANTCMNEEIQVDRVEKGLMLPDEHSEKKSEVQSNEVLLQQTLENNLTVLRNKTIWTDSPFFVPDDGENSEETNCNVDSEHTHGATDMIQPKVHFSHPEQESSNTKENLEHFKGALHLGKKECQYDNKPCKFKTMNTQTDSDKKSEEGQLGDVGLSKTSFSTMTRSFSETSLSSLSNCTSYFDEKASPCYCQNIYFGHPSSSGKLREFWAITKINVYPDDSRTYEVMPLTGKKPAELPDKSDSVFVLIPTKQGPPLTGKKPAYIPDKSDSVFELIPPKQGPYVPCNL